MDWNTLSLRADDILVAGSSRSGTNWTQQVVNQLIYQGQETPTDVPNMWVDRYFDFPTPANFDRPERRVLKTHLKFADVPADKLPNKIIHVTRRWKDVLAGSFGVKVQLSEQVLMDRIPMFTASNPLGGSTVENVASWRNCGLDSNRLLFIHYSQLLNDFDNTTAAIADFVGLRDSWDANGAQIRQHCAFAYMKERWKTIFPPAVAQGIQNRWQPYWNDSLEGTYQTELAKLNAQDQAWMEQ